MLLCRDIMPISPCCLEVSRRQNQFLDQCISYYPTDITPVIWIRVIFVINDFVHTA